MPVETNDANERFLELVVNESVTEWVDRTVEVAQPVGDVVECCRYARTVAGNRISVASAATEPDQQRQHVPRRPVVYLRDLSSPGRCL